MSLVDFTWLIGGPQGSGVESGANIFSKVCAEMGYQIFGKSYHLGHFEVFLSFYVLFC